jgi:molybdopterin-guanine dinucleotide biosynthesis protein A
MFGGEPLTNSAAVVMLAGGLGSRLGSNKPLRQLAGKPLICHVIEGVSGLSDEILVVIARDAPRNDFVKALPDYVRVINDEPDGKSPLIGIVTALRGVKSRYAAVLTCDIPFVNSQVIKLLLKREENADAVVPRWKTGHLEPLQAVYCREPTLEVAEEALREGNLSTADLINKLTRVTFVSIEDEIRIIDPELRTFFNVNTREDLSKAELILGQRAKGHEGSSQNSELSDK